MLNQCLMNFFWMDVSCFKPFMQSLKRTDRPLLTSSSKPLSSRPQHFNLFSLVTVVQPVTNLPNCNQLNNWTQKGAKWKHFFEKSALDKGSTARPPFSMQRESSFSSRSSMVPLWILISLQCCASLRVPSGLWKRLIWSVRRYLHRGWY